MNSFGRNFIRGLELPLTVRGVTVLDEDGNYNVYINILLSYDTQQKAAKHELKHITSEHFMIMSLLYITSLRLMLFDKEN